MTIIEYKQYKTRVAVGITKILNYGPRTFTHNDSL